MRILSFGEILFDVFGKDSKIGGAPFNFSAHTARAGAQSYLMTAVGTDALGDEAIQKVAHHRVDSAYISRSKRYGTGVCQVTLDANGIPRYDLVAPAAYDDIAYNDSLEKKAFDGVYFGTLSLRYEHNRAVLENVLRVHRGEVLVDVNVRLPFCDKDALLYAFEHATLIKISDEELPFVMRTLFSLTDCTLHAAAKHIAQRFPKIKLVLFTCGAEGSVAYDTRGGDLFSCPAEKAEVVSTVGAGDSFAATFMVHYMNGSPIPACLRQASKVSAFVVSQTEAIPEQG
jgi:fructokinase